MGQTRVRWWIVGAAALAALGGVQSFAPPVASAESSEVGVNVLLGCDVTDAVLEDLGQYGKVLDVLPEIRGVTLRADESALTDIRALSCVEAAELDSPVELADTDALPVPDLSDGANLWNLDAIDVTDSGGGRTVGYDGEGVYIAVIDTGLPHNWRCYFPEERIDTEHARAFTGGGGQPHLVSSQPEKWERDTDGHGTTVTSVILGFAYSGPDETLPQYFNGVAPKATVIPVRFHDKGEGGHWASTAAHSILYVVGLRTSGELGTAPIVINASWGDEVENSLVRAAIDYAIDNGVIFVAGAGNDGEQGMLWPGAHPEVISVAATGFVSEFPSDDSTTYRWIGRDVPENDASQHFIVPFSARALSGQELDLAAPGFAIPVAWTLSGTADWTFAAGTSLATPHVTGIAALMLQKNPTLTQAQVESILKSSALAISPGSATVRWPSVTNYSNAGNGNEPTWEDHDRVSISSQTFSWGSDATGAGLVLAGAALAATPDP